MDKRDFIYIHDLWKIFKKSNFTENHLELSNFEINSSDKILFDMLDQFQHTDLLFTVKISAIEFPVSCGLAKDQKVNKCVELDDKM